MTKTLSILLATNHLCDWTGSETLFLTLINALWEAGYSPTLYVRHLDKKWLSHPPLPQLRLVDDINLLKNSHFDLAHVQHNSCLLDVRSTFPTLPIIFSSLGTQPFLEQPPPFDVGVNRYLSISEEVRDNLTSRGIRECNIDILRNLVCCKTFHPISKIRPKPEHILVLSNKIDEPKKLTLKAAAKQINAQIKFIGGASKQLPPTQLTLAINNADIVVSLGRGVIEAMLCARVPLIFDINGGDGLVTPSNIDALQTHNFSGRLHGYSFTSEDLVNEFNKYQQDIGEQLCDIARSRFGIEQCLPKLLDIYDEVSSSPSPNSTFDHMAYRFSSQLAREDMKLAKLYRERLNDSNAELTRIKQTFSWKITAPLRCAWNTPTFMINALIKIIKNSQK